MTDNKGANRLYLATVAVYVGFSLLISKVIWFEIPTCISLIMSQLIIVIPALAYCCIRKIPITKLVPYKKISFSTGVLVVVSTYLMYPLMIVLNMVTLLFTKSGTASMQSEMSQFPLIVSTVLVALVPACVEEFVFRGVLFQTYRRKRVFSAILLSALLFGCMHMNVNQFAYTFVLGIYMAFLVEGTGSVFSSMLAHFTLNFTGVFLSWLIGQRTGAFDKTGDMSQVGDFLDYGNDTVIMLLFGILIWFIIAIGTTAGAIAIYLQICKMNGRREHIKTIFRKQSTEKLITIPLILAIAITIAIMVLVF